MAVKKGAEAVRTATASEKKAVAKKGKGANAEDLHEGVAPSWERFPGIAEAFPDLEEKVARHREITDMEAEKKELAAYIEAALILASEKRITVTDYVVTHGHSKSPSRILPEKLLEQGVELSVIEAATKDGIEYTYVQVTRRKL